MWKFRYLLLDKLLYLTFLFLDFPGMCFASTKCATVEPGKTWDLYPFCGRSTCVVSEDQPPRLLELVEDCGPLPLANDKCKLDEGMTIFSQKLCMNQKITIFFNRKNQQNRIIPTLLSKIQMWRRSQIGISWNSYRCPSPRRLCWG